MAEGVQKVFYFMFLCLSHHSKGKRLELENEYTSYSSTCKIVVAGFMGDKKVNYYL